MSSTNGDWKIFRGDGVPRRAAIPAPPPWRDLKRGPAHCAKSYQATGREIEAVNAALHLRRPLLLEGPPGSGKSSLAYAVAEELQLGPVHLWSINSRSTLREGLYRYDALGRMHQLRNPGPPPAPGSHGQDGGAGPGNAANAANAANAGDDADDIGSYISLEPLGTALLPGDRPAVLLIDEIDKSDIDLPNDMLHVLENGSFRIPELVRVAAKHPEVEVLTDPGEGSAQRTTAVIPAGVVQATTFPFVVITSNGERELPQAFLRRCIRHTVEMPEAERLRQIVGAHLGTVPEDEQTDGVFEEFVKRLSEGELLAVDQLLNAVFILTNRPRPSDAEWQRPG